MPFRFATIVPEPLSLAARRRVALAIGGTCFTLLVAYTIIFSAGRTTHGFIAYYAAARALVDGRFGPWIYDDARFLAYVQQLSQSQVLEIFGPNLPTMSALAIPFALLDPHTARIVWLALSLVLLAMSVGALAGDALAQHSRFVALTVALVMLSPAVLANLISAQAYIILLALLTVAYLRRNQQRLAGAALGAAFVLKSTVSPWLALLPFLRRWPTFLAATATIAAVVICTAPWVGLDSWSTYPGYVWRFVHGPATGVTAYQTTEGFFRHMCVGFPGEGASISAVCAPIASLAPTILIACAWLATLLVARGVRPRDWIPAAVCLTVLSAPIAEDHHFILLAIPIFWILRTAPPRWGLPVFAILFAVPARLTIHKFTTGWSSLLAYPRLYAAWLLWGLALNSMYRAKQANLAASAGDCGRL